MKELAAAYRPNPDAPQDQLEDFREYAAAYCDAWSDPYVRWLLSTVPSSMIFDDHGDPRRVEDLAGVGRGDALEGVVRPARHGRAGSKSRRSATSTTCCSRARFRSSSARGCTGSRHGASGSPTAPGAGARTPVWQAVCSGFRKQLDPREKTAMKAANSRPAHAVARSLGRAAGVADPPVGWRFVEEPRYVNQVATLELEKGAARLRTETTAGADWRDPQLRTVFEHQLLGA